MATTQEILATVREARSSESHFDRIEQALETALAMAQKEGDSALANELQDVQEKYAAEYRKAKETRDSAWPEFEKFVTQFERAMTGADKQP